MLIPTTELPAVVSPRAYALILTSPRLKRKLLPQGLATPYEILDYQHMLTLHDAKGSRATFERTQDIRFLQDGVSAILDHAWGDGVLITNYQNTVGELVDSIKDQGRRHLIVDLKRPMERGATLGFAVEREVMEGFGKDEEWFETIIDHPVTQVRCKVVFPKKRPCRYAVVNVAGVDRPLTISRLDSGKTIVSVDIGLPKAHTPYTIRWSW